MGMDKNSVRSLLNAAESGDCRKLEECLTKSPVNAINDQSQTALHFAAANGHQKAVRLLITKGATLDCRNWCDWTPLMYAAYYGHVNVVTYLVESKVDINVCNSRLVTPLICAARCGHTGVIEVLLDHGASVMPIKRVERNEDTGDKIISSPTTALMAAAQHGHHGIVSLLMQYGLPVDYENPYTGYTALMLSAINGHTKIVELLVEKGAANANLVNARNQTAYALSLLRKRTDVAAYLSERTQKRIEEIPTKFPPIIMAAKSGNIQEVEKIFRQNSNVDVNVFSDDGATPLIYASLNNHVDVVRLLLKKGAQTDHQDKLNGWTALMHATIKRHVEVVRALLKAGADIKIKNTKGMAVFDLALMAGLPEITRLLVPRAIGIPSNQSNDLDKNSKQKSLFSKVSGKMKRNAIVNRVPVHEIGLTGSSDVDDRVHTDELRKTSSVLSVLDANKSVNGSDKPRISLVSPQVNLPDDVVVPVLSPYPKLQNFDIPKIPILGAKLSNSNGSNSGEVYNSSNDSASLRALDQQNGNGGTGIKRPKMTGSNASFAPYQEPDSPQSSMTSSGFTSVSRNNGRGSMPNAPFKSPNDRFSKSPFPQWPNSPPVIYQAFSPDQHSGQPSHVNQPHLFYQPQKSKTPPPYFANDLSIRSISSSASDTERSDDIASLLRRLELEKYHSQFEEEEVDMEALREMDDGDLKMMGIDQTINRNRIMAAVGHKNKSRSLQNLPPNALYSPTPPGKVPSLISATGHTKARSGYQAV